MKNFMHIFVLATFLLGGFLSSPAVHAFDDAGSLSCITADCEQSQSSDNQSTDDNFPNEEPADNHLCGHCGHGCHHTHFYGNASDLGHSLNANKNKQFSLNSSMVASQLIYGLKRPPRIFA